MSAQAPRRTAVAAVVDDVREQILTGRLRPGDAVGEEEIARRLQLSRTPVREAIGRLVIEGLLRKDDNRTARVFEPSLDELLEIYEIRRPLEILASGLAADTADQTVVAILREHLAEHTDELTDDQWTLHESFHLTLFRASGRTQLVEIIAGLRLRSEPYVRFAAQMNPEYRQRSHREHGAMVDALAAGDRAAMEAVVGEHLDSTVAQVTGLLEHRVWLPTILPAGG